MLYHSDMVGEALRKARVSKGISLEKASSDLKIRATYLNALEEERFDQFPADVYTMGYLRAYAQYLGLEAGPLIEEFKKINAQRLQGPFLTVTPPPIHENSKVQGSLQRLREVVLKSCVPMIGLLLSALLLFFIFKTTTIKESLKEEAKIPLPVFTSPPTAQESLTVTSPLINEHILKITATELTWLLIEAEEGTRDITMRPGETVQYKSKKGFKLTIGNAGGIRLILNEKDLGPLGKSGEVKILTLP